ncbi:MAG: O-antigen ligase family protein [bacterium]|nr:O-antigen ligase family protein [bacterium]
MSRAIALPRPRAPVAPVAALLTYTGLHVLLALLMVFSQAFATLHALGALASGIYLAVSSRNPERATYVAGYVATAGVLWRMNRASVFWEYGKYGFALILILIWLRRRSSSKTATLAILYFMLLLPSSAYTISYFGLTELNREALSSNLSGPFALTVGILYFSSCNSRRIRLEILLRSLLWPIVSIATMAAYSTLTATNLRFTADSNVVTSGGFGPNQVSSVLGLGFILCLLLGLHCRGARLRWAYFAIGGLLLLQTILTFSRGGVFNIVVAVTILAFHNLRNTRFFRIFAAVTILAFLLGSFFLLPRINQWTGGALEERYSSFDTTGRGSIAESDLKIWKENPVLGVGPGLASRYRFAWYGNKISAHTEYTRALAEHGLFGAAALLCMMLIVWRSYRAAPGIMASSWVGTFSGWALAAMAHAGMRIAAIAFVFAIATICWPRPRPPQKPPDHRRVGRTSRQVPPPLQTRPPGSR